mmetsp:Transcript_23324/g.41429  ORF Transcript_23324/g.41429 Transcript_23324/m.41429 type:complete len:235 (+) Transcript_23324:1104-1808(+)
MKVGERFGISVLDEQLSIGSEMILRLGADLLKRNYGVTHLLSCNGSKPKLLEFVTKVLDIDDEEDQDILQYFDEAIDFIASCKGRIFIYCAAGRSRSATILAAYLMKTRKLTAEQALSTIRQVRDVQPNPGFLKQLKTWEEMLSCELCKLERLSEWYVEQPKFVVIACEQCDLPMVVLRKHGMEVDEATKTTMYEALAEVATKYYDGKPWYIDTVQRTIYTHMHWHARAQRFRL